MSIYPKGQKYMVDVRYAGALDGYKRVRREVSNHEDALALHDQIKADLKEYGKWPLEVGDKPLPSRPTVEIIRERPEGGGTLRLAAKLTIETHYHNTPYGRNVHWIIWRLVEFFEGRGKWDLDDITSDDIDAWVRMRFDSGRCANTINHDLSALSQISRLAVQRKPPLATATLPIKRMRVSPQEKWWLRPEDLEKVVTMLQDRAEYLFADFIQMLCKQGLRVEEGLRLRPRHFTGLAGERPMLKVPGTKTAKSEATIPLYAHSMEVTLRSIKRAEECGWDMLFPMTLRQADTKWIEVRIFLGVRDVPTATLKACRRTFAWYANEMGMPTTVLQRVLRHSTIQTTSGYLELIGGVGAEDSRKYMDKHKEEDKTGSGLQDAIAAYQATGATPEEVARFVKEIMT